MQCGHSRDVHEPTGASWGALVLGWHNRCSSQPDGLLYLWYLKCETQKTKTTIWPFKNKRTHTTLSLGFLPMPTWASRIMLTSLAPSPMDRVMGLPLEFFTIFTICDARGKNQHIDDKSKQTGKRYFNKDRLSFSLFGPAPSVEEPSGSTAQLCSFGTSAGRGSYSGWCWAPSTAWPHQWWSRSPCQQTTNFLNTAVKIEKHRSDEKV